MDPKALRRAFGTYITGVTVVTALDDRGVPVGFTANSFTSVSMDPPMLLVCPGRNLSSFDVFANTSRFAISVLAEGQEDVSNTFARSKGNRFEEANWTPDKQGCPTIDGAAAWFSCSVEQVIEAGDHIILIGGIDDHFCSERNGLGYMNGNYFSLGLEQEADRHLDGDSKGFAGILATREDSILVVDTPAGIRLPAVEIEKHADIRQTLKQQFNADLGAVYSIFEDKQTGASYTYFLTKSGDFNADHTKQLLPIEQLSNAKFASATEAIILKRFADEHKYQRFNLYVGDEARGKLHEI